MKRNSKGQFVKKAAAAKSRARRNPPTPSAKRPAKRRAATVRRAPSKARRPARPYRPRRNPGINWMGVLLAAGGAILGLLGAHYALGALGATSKTAALGASAAVGVAGAVAIGMGHREMGYGLIGGAGAMGAASAMTSTASAAVPKTTTTTAEPATANRPTEAAGRLPYRRNPGPVTVEQLLNDARRQSGLALVAA